jgi:hypothetical protein
VVCKGEIRKGLSPVTPKTKKSLVEKKLKIGFLGPHSSEEVAGNSGLAIDCKRVITSKLS